MAKTSYYFALSLDGYIARSDGRVDWLDSYFGDYDTPYDFKNYMKTVSAVVMGRKTFEKCLELGPLPVGGNPAFVYTQDLTYQTDLSGVTVIHHDVAQHIQQLREKETERIWVLGGGVLAAFMLEHGLLDEIVMSVVPVTIGSGIPWLTSFNKDQAWNLAEHYVLPNGMVQLIYRTEQGVK